MSLPAPDPANPLGGSGDKGVHYEIAIILIYQYLIPSAIDNPGLSEDDWVDGLDAFVQGIKDVLHADPRLGNPEVVFGAGQRPRGIVHHAELPRKTAGKIVSFQTIQFSLTEVIEA